MRTNSPDERLGAASAARLRELRRAHEVTQEAMAVAIGVSLTIYNRIEKHPDRRALKLSEAQLAAAYLGVAVSEIVDEARAA